MAPEWKESSCDQECQRWITACLLAHANGLSQPVPISLHGPHPGLPEPIVGFDYQDAAFYGNVFLGELFACSGGLLSGNDGALVESILTGRICGLSQACDLTYTGFCAELPGLGGACQFDGGYSLGFSECQGASTIYLEVITTYL